jgi:nitrite reductase (NO-forming)/hydroxylamine reductase
MRSNITLHLITLWLATLGAAANAANIEAGSLAYQKYCATCHGPAASGSEPFFPSLNDRLPAMDNTEVISAVMNGSFGRGGDLDGHTIPLMPSWAMLDNQNIADIVNYLLHMTDAEGRGTVSVEQVANIRASGLEHIDDQPMSRADLERATDIYNHRCAVCHGVDRMGAAGSALQAWRMRPQQARSIMHYGTPWGMPNWGTSDRLTSSDIDLLARFLSLDIQPDADFLPHQVLGSWFEAITPEERPTTRELSASADNIAVSLLHDTGQIALIDMTSKKVLSIVDTGIAPHQIGLRADRWLYVLSRGGELAMVDLYMEQPAVVARVRIGFEARTFALYGDHVIAGATAPGQYTILQADTLRPLLTRSLPVSSEKVGPPQIGQVHSLEDGVLIATRTEGDLYVLQSIPSDITDVKLKHIGRYPFMREGSIDSSGRYLFLPTDGGTVVVVDRTTAAVSKLINVPDLAKPSTATAFAHPDEGSIWAIASMQGDQIRFLSAAQGRVVRDIKLPGGGTYAMATHPGSPKLWADMSLNAGRTFSTQLAIINLNDLDAAPRLIPVTEPAGEQSTTARVIYPRYNEAGDEIWVTVYDRQDRGSSVVVLDAQTEQVKSVIDDNRLITPIRTILLADLM